MGAKILELYCYRERSSKRETKLLGILSFVYSTVWKVLFGKQADSLEKSTEQEDECIHLSVSHPPSLSIPLFSSPLPPLGSYMPGRCCLEKPRVEFTHPLLSFCFFLSHLISSLLASRLPHPCHYSIFT